MKCNHKNVSQVAFWGSVITIVLAALVSVLDMSLWLAGTQWAIVSVLLAIYAVYLKEDSVGGE